MQYIYDKDVDCYCNKDNTTCNGNCSCYCHVPKWFRNIIWKIQRKDSLFRTIVVILFMSTIGIVINIYLRLFKS